MVDAADYDFWKDNYGDANLSLGIATLSGTVNIDVINGFMPTNGNMFTILTAESVKVGSLTLSGEKAGFSLVVNPTSLVLQYTGGGLAGNAAPEPVGLVLAGMAIIGFSTMRRRS
jgi:hypothetical protein